MSVATIIDERLKIGGQDTGCMSGYHAPIDQGIIASLVIYDFYIVAEPGEPVN